MAAILSVFYNQRMLLMLLMGFASGLPIALTGGTLQAWMVDEHVNLKVIGIFSLVGMPYTFKFLWAPFLDRYAPPFLGRRRGWMLILQVLLIPVIIGLGTLHPAALPEMVAAGAVLLAFLSASQDVVLDAYRTEILSPEELGAGAAVFVMGYRLAMLTSGALALALADQDKGFGLSWPKVYFVMACLLGIGLLATFMAKEPSGRDVRAPRTLVEAVIDPFKNFFSRGRSAFEILVFVILYKIGDVMALALITPFILSLGFAKTDLAAVNKVLGLVAAIAGSLAAGGLMSRWGMKRSLWVFGILQAGSTMVFSVLAWVGKSHAVMAAAVGIEQFCSGMGNAAFLAFLMALCNRRYTATQFALLTSLMSLSRNLAGPPSSFLVTHYGWTRFFVGCALVSIPGLLMLLRYDSWMKSAEVETQAASA